MHEAKWRACQVFWSTFRKRRLDAMPDDAPWTLAPHQLLSAFPEVNVCAPMVRYSKLPFRALTARYDTHITTTPMILAAEFSRSQHARDADFSTHGEERGTFTLTPDYGTGTVAPKERSVQVRGALVCQLAASRSGPLADASELISPFVDGVDINCGCPQPWAYQEQIGSYLLRQPETVRDMVRAIKSRLGDGYCVSVKIRVDSDLRNTDTLVRNALHAGASLLSIHGRTRTQPSASHPVDLDKIRFAVDAAQACGLHTAWGTAQGDAWVVADGGAGGSVPTVVNGDIWTHDDALAWRARTGARGAMSARGLLANPVRGLLIQALFSGYAKTPPEAVDAFVERAIAWGLPFSLMQYVACSFAAAIWPTCLKTRSRHVPSRSTSTRSRAPRVSWTGSRKGGMCRRTRRGWFRTRAAQTRCRPRARRQCSPTALASSRPSRSPRMPAWGRPAPLPAA